MSEQAAVQNVLHGQTGIGEEFFDDGLHAFGGCSDARVSTQTIDGPPIHGDLGLSMGVSYPVARRYARAARRSARPNVLVIAPHPDDDAIGCGGTLLRLAARGARITVLYVTDGSASHVKSKRFPPAVLRDVREGEARAALRTLGIRRQPYFLRAPDSGLAQLDAIARQRLVAAVAQRIAVSRAQVIFSPWPRDPHPDHVATATIVEAALAACARRPAVYFYRVWLAVRGNPAEQPRSDETSVYDVALSASDVRRKRAAIAEHRSQTGVLIDDDPDGFCIDADVLEAWLTPVERFYRRGRSQPALRAGFTRALTPS